MPYAELVRGAHTSSSPDEWPVLRAPASLYAWLIRYTPSAGGIMEIFIGKFKY